MDQNENFSSHNRCADDSVVRRFGVLEKRSEAYETWVLDQLEAHKCRRILDAACGTGVDSLFLVEKGYYVVSTDDSEAMLHYAKQARDKHRSQHKGVVNWDIEKANWLSLNADISEYGEFDAVLCMGNSMIDLIDTTPNLDLFRLSLENFKSMLKPGGVLLIDHRNMDVIIDHGTPTNKNVYLENDKIQQISSEPSIGKQNVVNITFDMIVAPDQDTNTSQSKQISRLENLSTKKVSIELMAIRTADFANMLRNIFGEECEQEVFADLSPPGTVSNPAYYQHVICNK